jgi:hypothetical protein
LKAKKTEIKDKNKDISALVFKAQAVNKGRVVEKEEEEEEEAAEAGGEMEL